MIRNSPLQTRNPASPLERILDHARRRVPHFAGCGPALHDFPVVSKSEMMSSPERFIAVGPGYGDGTLAKFIRDFDASGGSEVDFDRDVLAEQTSGSSGLPFRVPKSRRERAAAALGIWEWRKTADSQLQAGTFLAIAHRRVREHAMESAGEFLRHLRKNRFRWIHVTPSFLSTLAGWMEEFREIPLPDLKFAETAGQHLDPQFRRRIEEGTGIRIADQYGCREVWAIAYDADGRGFTPLARNVHVELLREDNSPVSSPGCEGRVVVTSLHQELFPFIRYDTGDRATLAGGEEHAPSFRLAPCRSHELIVGSAGVSGIAIFKAVMARVYQEGGYRPVKRLQFVQRSERLFDIAIECPHATGEGLRRSVEFHFNRLGVLGAAVRFRIAPPETEAAVAQDAKPTLFTNRLAGAGAANPGCNR